jgi:hypothetical protein
MVTLTNAELENARGKRCNIGWWVAVTALSPSS